MNQSRIHASADTLPSGQGDSIVTKKRKAPTRKATTQRLTWRSITVCVTHTPDYINKGWDHIELRVVSPKGAILPITQTGYLSHFLDADELKRARGAAAFFLAWIEHEAKTKRWREAESKTRQLSLF